MTRKRTWDTEEPVRLRRSIDTAEEYQNESYHELWFNPNSFLTTGATTNLNSRYEAVALRGGSDEWIKHNFRVPNNWKYGKFQVDIWIRPSGTTSGNFDLDLDIAYMLNDPTSATSTDLYSDNSVFANPATVAHANSIKTFTSSVVATPNELDVVYGLHIERLGSSGSDTLAGLDLRIMLVRVTWLPVITRV